MYQLFARILATLLLGALPLSIAGAAETRYVTDQLEVTMRSGTSLQNEILQMLQSGEAVTLIEQDLGSGYSLVESVNGRQGYVLSRFLNPEPAARQQLRDLRAEHDELVQVAQQQSTELDQIRQALMQQQADNEALKSALLASEEELSQVRSIAADSINIVEQNKHLQTLVTQLRREKEQLTATNDDLSDSTKIDWFVRGGGLFLIAFIVGILVTRIRWKKRDSWGSY